MPILRVASGKAELKAAIEASKQPMAAAGNRLQAFLEAKKRGNEIGASATPNVGAGHDVRPEPTPVSKPEMAVVAKPAPVGRGLRIAGSSPQILQPTRGEVSSEVVKQAENSSKANLTPNEVAGGGTQLVTQQQAAEQSRLTPEPQTQLDSLSASIPAGRESASAGQVLETSLLAAEFHHPMQPEKFGAEDVESFKRSIEVLKAHMTDPEVVSQQLAYTLELLHRKPEFTSVLKEKPSLTGDLIRAMRASYGVTLAVKQANRERNNAGRAKAKAAKQTQFAGVEELAGIEFDL